MLLKIPQNFSINNDKLKCKYCNKFLSRIDNLKRHEINCKNKHNEINKLKYEIEILKNNKNQIITTNNHTNNNNTNNHTNNNTVNIIKFGTEKLNEILSEQEMLKITEFINSSINESIKRVHFNDKRPELKNIVIKNFITQKKYNNLYDCYA